MALAKKRRIDRCRFLRLGILCIFTLFYYGITIFSRLLALQKSYLRELLAAFSVSRRGVFMHLFFSNGFKHVRQSPHLYGFPSAPFAYICVKFRFFAGLAEFDVDGDLPTPPCDGTVDPKRLSLVGYVVSFCALSVVNSFLFFFTVFKIFFAIFSVDLLSLFNVSVSFSAFCEIFLNFLIIRASFFSFVIFFFFFFFFFARFREQILISRDQNSESQNVMKRHHQQTFLLLIREYNPASSK